MSARHVLIAVCVVATAGWVAALGVLTTEWVSSGVILPWVVQAARVALVPFAVAAILAGFGQSRQLRLQFVAVGLAVLLTSALIVVDPVHVWSIRVTQLMLLVTALVIVVVDRPDPAAERPAPVTSGGRHRKVA